MSTAAWRTVIVMCATLLPALPGAGQETPAGSEVLEVGQRAPDFALTGSTRFGVLRDPVRLSDFRGKTVVLAFFFRARTPG